MNSREVRLDALEVIGRAGLAIGGAQLGSAQRAARQLIDGAPYRESGYVLLMQSLEAQGNVAEALRVYEQLAHAAVGRARDDPARRRRSPSTRRSCVRRPNPTRPSAPPERRPRVADDGAAADLAAGRARRPLGAGDDRPGGRARRARTVARRRRARGRLGSARERLLLLSGEPGVGKTRLLAETAKRAHARRGAGARRAALPEETLVAFQPFLEALGHYIALAPLDELRATTRAHGAELARLVPELRRRLPELPPTDEGDSETERYRLFEAVVGLLGDLSASMPVLIVIDDLHWADRPTLMLLRHLARSPRSGRLSIIGAYRSTERVERGLLGGRSRTCATSGLLKQIELAGLPERDAARLVGLRVGRAPSADFSRPSTTRPRAIRSSSRRCSVTSRTRGSRCRSAGAYDLQRFGLPDDVREVISRRLARLGEHTVEAMRVASVIGREFDAGPARGRAGVRRGELPRRARRGAGHGTRGRVADDARSLQLLARADPRDAVRGHVGPRRARDPPPGRASRSSSGATTSNTNALAHHFTRAADPEYAERAIRYALEAGEQAAAMLAHEQAADHYARALEVLEQFEPEALSTPLRAAARSSARPGSAAASARGPGRRSARRRAGRPSGRRRRARARGDRRLAALPAAARGRRPRADRDARPGARDDQRRAERDPRQPALGLCGALYYSEERDRMRVLSAEATEIAAALDDPRATALAAAARRRAYWDPDHLEQRLSRLGTARARGYRGGRHRADPPGATPGSRSTCSSTATWPGSTPRSRRSRAGARELRQPLYLWQVAVWRAMRALLAGPSEHAERLASEAFSAGIRPEGETATQYYAIQLLAIRREQRRMGELESALREQLDQQSAPPGLADGARDAAGRDRAPRRGAGRARSARRRRVRRDPARRRLDRRDGAAGRRRGGRRRRARGPRSCTNCCCRSRPQRRDRARDGVPRIGRALPRAARGRDRRSGDGARPFRARAGGQPRAAGIGAARPYAARLRAVARPPVPRRARWSTAARTTAEELHLPAVARRGGEMTRGPSVPLSRAPSATGRLVHKGS